MSGCWIEEGGMVFADSMVMLQISEMVGFDCRRASEEAR